MGEERDIYAGDYAYAERFRREPDERFPPATNKPEDVSHGLQVVARSDSAGGNHFIRGKTVAKDPAALTKRQQELLDFMLSHQAETGLPPTVREMQGHMGVGSPNGVMCHLIYMEKKGYVRNVGKGTSHSWRPTKRSVSLECPHCGEGIEYIEEL